MAEPKTSAPKIEYRHNVGRAEHELGVRIGGYFIPFVVVPDSRVAHLTEAAQNATEENGGEEEEGE